MRILRALSDLPWWTGLPIFLVGNLLVPMGLSGYIVGLCICSFGVWVFSKLLPPNEMPEAFFAIVGYATFSAILYLVNPAFLSYTYSELYATRTILGMLIGLGTFFQFRK